MSKVLKFLDFLAGMYNNLSDDQKIIKKVVSNYESPVKKNQRPVVQKSEGKPSRRKGERQNSEVIYNHPRKDFHS